jgi:phosphomannomutase
MNEPIISVSGLRGIVGQSLTPEIAAAYVSAFLGEAPPGPIVVTRDGRASGPAIARGVFAAIHAAGRIGHDGGVAATPTTGILVHQCGAAGGIQISASHNPAQYNGLKLFGPDGRVLSADVGQRVLARYRLALTPALASGEKESLSIADTVGEHLRRVLAVVDIERIRARSFRVTLDSNHGAGAVVGRPLLEALGCDVVVLGGEPDGEFAHEPEPTDENLSGVCDQVATAGVDVGFCQDPDADRLAIIDAKGVYLGEEYTLAICVDHVLRQTPGPIVTNCSTSRMAEVLAADRQAPFFRSAVGEANVVDLMLARGAVLGGEGNGGVIDPRVVLVRDSMTAMALVLDAMASRGESVAELAAAIPRFAMHKLKLAFPTERFPAAMDALARRFADATADRLDGLRLDWPGAWLLIRASNTEPVVRIMAEASEASEAERLCREASDVLEAM